MAIFKCKMCGGTIEFNQGDSVGVCDSCGTKQTLPRLDDEKRIQLYDRANYFRRENEFDKAMGIYEIIIADEKEDAEAYWGIVLCKYGIEYVEDPRTHKRIPTVNRAQYTSIFDDEDYQRAVKYADGYQRDIYEAEAHTIDSIQKGILEISNKEEPFDVFICYKESDSTGERTQDSVLAQDIYKALTNEGYKVFFSRITLESKLGQQYEPYIFAALNSAKVMLVIGTKKENFEAVWVKNEWSRFLSIIKNDTSKVLIPCYKDISPYDMPEEFTYLQSQDMGKIGFIQDLLHGISKVVKKSTPKETVVINSGNAEVEPLLRRAFIFLEDGDWENADQYCERVLDIDPENAMAYVGKLMVDLKLKKQEQLGGYIDGYEDNQYYQKARRYANSNLNTQFDGYLESINNIKIENTYQKLISSMKGAETETVFLSIADEFKELKDYKDSTPFAEKCLEKAEECKKDYSYDLARSYMAKKDIRHYEYAIEEFKKIPGWKDSLELIGVCETRIQDLEEQEKANQIEQERKEEERRNAEEKAAEKRKKTIAIILPIIVAITVLIALLFTVIIPKTNYDSAIKLIEQGEYDKAYSILEDLGKAEEISADKYKRAIELNESGDYKQAASLLFGLEYKNSSELLNEIATAHQDELAFYIADVGDVVKFGEYEQDGNKSNGKERIEWIVLSKEDKKLLLISKYILEHKAFDKGPFDYEITWENSDVRTWLNETFLTKAFTDDEQEIIVKSDIKGEKIQDTKDTEDKVFLLSVNDVGNFFREDKERACKATAYSIKSGVDKCDNGNSRWWLRTNQSFGGAYIISNTGIVVYSSTSMDKQGIGVRPAIWVSVQ